MTSLNENPMNNPNVQPTEPIMLIASYIKYCSPCRAEVEEFFTNMDRDFDGKLSFAEFMGEETPLEKVG